MKHSQTYISGSEKLFSVQSSAAMSSYANNSVPSFSVACSNECVHYYQQPVYPMCQYQNMDEMQEQNPCYSGFDTSSMYCSDHDQLSFTSFNNSHQQTMPTNSVPEARAFLCSWISNGVICGTCMMDMQEMVSHIANHVNEDYIRNSKFVCLWDGCGRNYQPFQARYKLINHIRIHTGEKPFTCLHPRCGRSFANRENLRIHKRIHSGEKPFCCTHEGCVRKFASSSDRKKHMAVHSNTKNHVCSHKNCSKHYVHASSLRKHILRAHRPPTH